MKPPLSLLLALILFISVAWPLAQPAFGAGKNVASQIGGFGPQVAASLALKCTFIHTAHGYQLQTEAPQAPSGLKPEELQAWMAMAQRDAGEPALGLTFPEHYSDGTQVCGQGMTVSLKPLGSNAASAQIEDGTFLGQVKKNAHFL